MTSRSYSRRINNVLYAVYFRLIVCNSAQSTRKRVVRFFSHNCIDTVKIVSRDMRTRAHLATLNICFVGRHLSHTKHKIRYDTRKIAENPRRFFIIIISIYGLSLWCCHVIAIK